MLDNALVRTRQVFNYIFLHILFTSMEQLHRLVSGDSATEQREADLESLSALVKTGELRDLTFDQDTSSLA